METRGKCPYEAASFTKGSYREAHSVSALCPLCASSYKTANQTAGFKRAYGESEA